MMVSTSSRSPRIFIADADFQSGKKINLSGDQAHYLRSVMRLAEGSSVRLFNGVQGDWLSVIKEANKKNVILEISQQISEQKNSPDVDVVVSVLKKEAFDLCVEKASELGVQRFQPVICDHTVVHKINVERAQRIATEAAKQCERQDVMQVLPVTSLKNILNSWNKERKLMCCLERVEALPIRQSLDHLAGHPVSVLIGPEGGFSEAEKAAIAGLPFALPVNLGSRILRSETALMASLACVMISKEN